MKINEEKQNALLKNIKYIALLVGLLSLAISYFWGYSNLKVVNDELNVEIDSLQARLDDLEEKKKNEKMYKEGIETFNADTEKLLAKFDAGLSPQRIIVDYQGLCDELGVIIPTMSFSEPIEVFTFGSTEGLVGHSKATNISVTGTYENIKDFITKVMTTAGRRRVPSTIGFSFDSSLNSVTCSIAVTEYAVIGGERTETEPTIPAYNRGVSNIFFSGGVGAVVQ